MRRILVVEDNPDELALLRMSLKAAGFAVTTASTGEEALKQAKGIPDLIVLDLVLPEMDGFTVCERLRKDGATAAIPILMLTGYPSQLKRLAGLAGGANDFVAKPITAEELIARIKALLNGAPDASAALRPAPPAPRHQVHR
jgi:DNA-binding response OmpR family regulator